MKMIARKRGIRCTTRSMRVAGKDDDIRD